MNVTGLVAIVIVCITAIIIVRIWASTKRKFPR
ncbi:hypothetical protein EES45_23065 [Streptomyces sp. ADI97-07]|nr:hypothetical protein EES45_23065 [Streptomyces sp. ADI97-07]